MSILQVSNLHFESTGNNRLQYTGSNAYNLVAGGTTVATVNTSAVQFPLQLTANTISTNSLNVSNTISTNTLNVANTISTNTLNVANLMTSNSITVRTVSANGSNGTAGQVLTSSGSANVYWSPIVADSIPLGTVVDFAGTSAPSKWLFGFGQNVSRSTYAELFAILGTTYGAGDGSTTFGLPDLRGRVIAGKDDMGGTSANRLTNQSGGLNGDTLGATGGAETHTLTTAQLAAHTHTYNISLPGGGLSKPIHGSSDNGTPVGYTSGSAGSGAAHNNVQPTIILNKIIYAGV
jgi:microcystin-dependent protein